MDHHKTGIAKIAFNGAADASDPVCNLMRGDRLLVRAMEEGRPDTDGISFRAWDDEIGYMRGHGRDELPAYRSEERAGMVDASATLLVAGAAIPTYKPYGFLIDAEKVTVTSVCERDNSTSSGTGGLRGGRSLFPVLNENTQDDYIDQPARGLEKLDALAALTREHKLTGLNEINADIPIDAVQGLFVASSATMNVLDALAIQHHLRKAHGLDLPLFQYDRTNTPEPLKPLCFTGAEINAMIEQIRPVFRNGYRKHFEETEGTGRAPGTVAAPAPSGSVAPG